MKNMFKRWMENFKKDERGLTLVELLAVVVILAIVGLIAFVSIGNVIENSKKDAHVANAQQVISAAELYEASGGNLPATGTNEEIDLVDSTDATYVLDTVDTDMIDPWTQEADSENSYISTFTLNYTPATDGNTGEFEITSTHDNCGFEDETKTNLASEGRGVCETD